MPSCSGTSSSKQISPNPKSDRLYHVSMTHTDLSLIQRKVFFVPPAPLFKAYTRFKRAAAAPCE